MSTVKAVAPVPATSSVAPHRAPADPNTQAHPPPTSTATASPASTQPPANGTTAATASTTTPEVVPRSKYKTFILSNGVFEVEQRYEIREIIGQGAYGVVCSALDMKTNTLVAIKKIENVFDHRSLAKRTLRELKLCRYFQHENVSAPPHISAAQSRKRHVVVGVGWSRVAHWPLSGSADPVAGARHAAALSQLQQHVSAEPMQPSPLPSALHHLLTLLTLPSPVSVLRAAATW